MTPVRVHLKCIAPGRLEGKAWHNIWWSLRQKIGRIISKGETSSPWLGIFVSVTKIQMDLTGVYSHYDGWASHRHCNDDQLGWTEHNGLMPMSYPIHEMGELCRQIPCATFLLQLAVGNYGYSLYIVRMRLDSIPKDTSTETSTDRAGPRNSVPAPISRWVFQQ